MSEDGRPETGQPETTPPDEEVVTAPSERPANWQRFTVAPSILADHSAPTDSQAFADDQTPFGADLPTDEPSTVGELASIVPLECENGELDVAYRLAPSAAWPSSFPSLAASLTRINLAGNALREIPAALTHCTALVTLILDSNELTSLASLPANPFRKTLTTLWVNRNQLSDILAAAAEVAPAAPSISNFSSLFNPGAPPPDLTDEDVATNVYRRLRVGILHYLPTLTVLDGLPVTAEERSEASQRGSILVKSHKDASTSSKAGASVKAKGRMFRSGATTKDGYGRLDDDAESGVVADESLTVRDDLDQSRVGQTRTFVTMGRSEMTGKYSEGNRFIRDDRL